MADEAVADQQGGGGGGKRGLILIAGVAIITLLLGLGGGYVLGKSNSGGGEEGATAEAGGDAGGAEGAVGAAIVKSSEVTELGSFTINLRDSAGGRLLQMDIALEGEPGAGEAIKESRAALRDAVIMLASDFSYLELEGTDGRLRLRDEVHRRVNAVLAPEKITRVYFTKFVVQ